MRALARGDLVSIGLLGENFHEDAVHSGIDVARGLWRIRPAGLSVFLSGMPELVGHSGATGSYAYYIEEYDAGIVGSFNQTEWAEGHVEFLLSKILPTLMRLKAIDS